MKNTIGILVSLVLGGIVGFFGVFVSVFSDGDIGERLATIGIVLLIYLLLGGAFGLIWPGLKWIQGLMLALPGAVLLLYYTIKEFNILHIPYILIILILPVLASSLTSKLSNKPIKNRK